MLLAVAQGKVMMSQGQDVNFDIIVFQATLTAFPQYKRSVQVSAPWRQTQQAGEGRVPTRNGPVHQWALERG